MSKTPTTWPTTTQQADEVVFGLLGDALAGIEIFRDAYRDLLGGRRRDENIAPTLSALGTLASLVAKLEADHRILGEYLAELQSFMSDIAVEVKGDA